MKVNSSTGFAEKQQTTQRKLFESDSSSDKEPALIKANYRTQSHQVTSMQTERIFEYSPPS